MLFASLLLFFDFNFVDFYKKIKLLYPCKISYSFTVFSLWILYDAVSISNYDGTIDYFITQANR